MPDSSGGTPRRIWVPAVPRSLAVGTTPADKHKNALYCVRVYRVHKLLENTCHRSVVMVYSRLSNIQIQWRRVAAAILALLSIASDLTYQYLVCCHDKKTACLYLIDRVSHL